MHAQAALSLWRASAPAIGATATATDNTGPAPSTLQAALGPEPSSSNQTHHTPSPHVTPIGLTPTITPLTASSGVNKASPNNPFPAAAYLPYKPVSRPAPTTSGTSTPNLSSDGRPATAFAHSPSPASAPSIAPTASTWTAAPPGLSPAHSSGAGQGPAGGPTSSYTPLIPPASSHPGPSPASAPHLPPPTIPTLLPVPATGPVRPFPAAPGGPSTALVPRQPMPVVLAHAPRALMTPGSAVPVPVPVALRVPGPGGPVPVSRKSAEAHQAGLGPGFGPGLGPGPGPGLGAYQAAEGAVVAGAGSGAAGGASGLSAEELRQRAEQLREMMGCGFDRETCEDVLLQSDGDMDRAISTLLDLAAGGSPCGPGLGPGPGPGRGLGHSSPPRVAPDLDDGAAAAIAAAAGTGCDPASLAALVEQQRQMLGQASGRGLGAAASEAVADEAGVLDGDGDGGLAMGMQGLSIQERDPSGACGVGGGYGGMDGFGGGGGGGYGADCGADAWGGTGGLWGAEDCGATAAAAAPTAMDTAPTKGGGDVGVGCGGEGDEEEHDPEMAAALARSRAEAAGADGDLAAVLALSAAEARASGAAGGGGGGDSTGGGGGGSSSGGLGLGPCSAYATPSTHTLSSGLGYGFGSGSGPGSPRFGGGGGGGGDDGDAWLEDDVWSRFFAGPGEGGGGGEEEAEEALREGVATLKVYFPEADDGSLRQVLAMAKGDAEKALKVLAEFAAEDAAQWMQSQQQVEEDAALAQRLADEAPPPPSESVEEDYLINTAEQLGERVHAAVDRSRGQAAAAAVAAIGRGRGLSLGGDPLRCALKVLGQDFEAPEDLLSELLGQQGGDVEATRRALRELGVQEQGSCAVPHRASPQPAAAALGTGPDPWAWAQWGAGGEEEEDEEEEEDYAGNAAAGRQAGACRGSALVSRRGPGGNAGTSVTSAGTPASGVAHGFNHGFGHGNPGKMAAAAAAGGSQRRSGNGYAAPPGLGLPLGGGLPSNSAALGAGRHAAHAVAPAPGPAAPAPAAAAPYAAAAPPGHVRAPLGPLKSLRALDIDLETGFSDTAKDMSRKAFDVLQLRAVLDALEGEDGALEVLMGQRQLGRNLTHEEKQAFFNRHRRLPFAIDGMGRKLRNGAQAVRVAMSDMEADLRRPGQPAEAVAGTRARLRQHRELEAELKKAADILQAASKRLHAHASADLFTAVNARIWQDWRTDLHTLLNEEEVLPQLEKVLAWLCSAKASFRWQIITGKGLHSRGDGPKLARIVGGWLEDRGLPWREEPGAMVVSLSAELLEELGAAGRGGGGAG
ncbi:hypothetical protein HYH03_004565 [Edaphochlamys debaryana]|uniref:Smr domain-containing protein n=1 Tax=Edaphochlamys debaryana TaxID=47281 RepID=A0A836C228_9CHLO|nr:hypothetical protein HYH03_004565 [Edaphochlamys debaryana]|eukprot:KAG2497410.1 hypothetical protein HYH03_004565 [Edaphochlamys debaryana]